MPPLRPRAAGWETPAVRELSGRRVRLTPTTAADAPALRSIRASAGVVEWWDEPDPGFPEVDDPELTLLTIRHEGEITGLVQFAEELEPKYRHASVDLFVAPAHQRHGIGSEAIALVVDHLLGVRGHHRITIDPAAANAAAIGCYAKAGFERVGVLRLAERDHVGEGWHDQLLMELVVEPRGRMGA
jgi:aminoglycoside 6'-N-acetyltransferase